MFRLTIINSHLLPNHHNMGATQSIVEVLKKDLYSIQPILPDIDRKLLGLAYTPGVGAVCLDIQQHPELADKLTFRRRAVAIVSDGSVLQSEGHQFMPVMDWFVVQIKHYSNYDAFPFVIKKNTNREALLRDLATTYGTVIYLDQSSIDKIPDNLLFLKHQTIACITKSDITDAKATSSALSYFIAKGIKGSPGYQDYQTAIIAPLLKRQGNEQPFIFTQQDNNENARLFHAQYEGKIKIVVNYDNFDQLKKVFTEQHLRQVVKIPGVYSKTSRLAAIVSDGTAILGFGDIGPMAGLPVMEGKALLFKLLGEVDVLPLCIYPRATAEEEIEAIANTVGNFMAVNLQDIKAPQCFDIESGLKNKKMFPVFHDDQHGTAIVVLAALINAAKVASKDIFTAKIIVNGAGAAGITIAKLLASYGSKNIRICDTKGAIFKGRKQGMNEAKRQIAELTNFEGESGLLDKILEKSDVFIGVSAAGALKGEWIQKMNEKPIIFALANPQPQIFPQDAKKHGAFIYGSGRSDFSNQINNSLVFPGIFRSIKQHNIKQITQQMKLKAAVALSKCLDHELSPQYIIPASLDKHLSVVISQQIGGKH